MKLLTKAIEAKLLANGRDRDADQPRAVRARHRARPALQGQQATQRVRERGEREREDLRMTTSHTPGPWTMQDARRLMGQHKAHLVFTDDEKEANARLIAAAPDLLAALRNVETYAEAGIHGDMSWSAQERAGYYAEALVAVRNQARAAIAKAVQS